MTMEKPVDDAGTSVGLVALSTVALLCAIAFAPLFVPLALGLGLFGLARGCAGIAVGGPRAVPLFATIGSVALIAISIAYMVVAFL